jgi:hypothetical protein
MVDYTILRYEIRPRMYLAIFFRAYRKVFVHLMLAIFNDHSAIKAVPHCFHGLLP